MPYPKPDDPDFCAGSGETPDELNEQLSVTADGGNVTVGVVQPEIDKKWYRCPRCQRLISVSARRQFFPHVSNRLRARKRDDVQEGLDAHGFNRPDL